MLAITLSLIYWVIEIRKMTYLKTLRFTSIHRTLVRTTQALRGTGRPFFSIFGVRVSRLSERTWTVSRKWNSRTRRSLPYLKVEGGRKFHELLSPLSIISQRSSDRTPLATSRCSLVGQLIKARFLSRTEHSSHMYRVWMCRLRVQGRNVKEQCLLL